MEIIFGQVRHCNTDGSSLCLLAARSYTTTKTSEFCSVGDRNRTSEQILGVEREIPKDSAKLRNCISQRVRKTQCCRAHAPALCLYVH
jgi:hypothetical protein